MKISALLSRLRVPSTKGAQSARWTNRDLEPIPREARKWGVGSLVAYWISDAFNAATWEFASSIIAVGLTWRESIIIVAIAFFLVSFVISLNGTMGVLYHVPFPILARASWGFYGAYIPVISRAILAIFWFAVQTMNGALSMQVMLGAIWPSFLKLPNHIPADQGLATNTMASFLLFWLIQLPFLCMHPNNLRWLFLVKSILVPTCWIAMLIWAMVTPHNSGIFGQKPSVSGAAYSWAFLSSLTSVIGNYATLSVNQCDFSRYSRVSPRWQILYVPMLPAIFAFVAFIGIACSSAGLSKYGVLAWDPLVLISFWPSRAARFFAASSFALASLGVNISANSLSAANDLAALSPRYVDIRRGQLLCALISWALVPWKILASAGSFLDFMSGYAIFLGPIAIILVVDFYVIHHMRYDVHALYQPDSIYSFPSTAGVNPRAVAAFLIGVAPSLPGFVSTINPNIDVGAGLHPFQFGWLLGLVGSGLTYWLLCKIWPPTEGMIERAVYPNGEEELNGFELADASLDAVVQK